MAAPMGFGHGKRDSCKDMEHKGRHHGKGRRRADIGFHHVYHGS